MKAPLATLVAILSGVLVIIGLLLRPMLDGMLAIRFQLALILAGAAALVGVANLLVFHLGRIQRREKRSVYSFVALASFLVTLLAGILMGSSTRNFNQIVTGIQFPIEASLMGLAAISMAFSSLTLINRKNRNPFYILFLASGLFFLLILIGYMNAVDSPTIRQIIEIVKAIPLGGVRGLLVGIALGSLLTGLRVILGTERPYEG
jgi:hypothetical protein